MGRVIIPDIDLSSYEDEDRWFPVGVLMVEMGKAGCWSNRRYMYKLEDQGRLTLPRLRTPRGISDRKIKKQHIREIIAAFSPGGKGEWHYD